MIYVTGHNFSYTDIDSIVSSIGLAYILNKQGKEAEAAPRFARHFRRPQNCEDD